MTQTFIINVEPMGAPRMTRADKWRKREVVVRYHAYSDAIRAACSGVLADPVYVGFTAYLSMPASWSKKKRAAMTGQHHGCKPDVDNIAKGIFDALFESDQCVSTGFIEKRWDDGLGARIELVVGDAALADAARELSHVLGSQVPGHTPARRVPHLRHRKPKN